MSTYINYAITGEQFVRCMSVPTIKVPSTVRYGLATSYHIGNWQGVYKIAVEALKYCVHLCLYEGAKITFKSGNLQLRRYSKYWTKVIKGELQHRYPYFDYLNPKMEPGNLLITPSIPPDKRLSYEKKRGLDIEILTTGEFSETIYDLINSNTRYYTTQVTYNMKDIAEQIHWYFPMYTVVYLKEVINEMFRLIVKFGKYDIPFDLSWYRHKNDKEAFMMRSRHSPRDQKKFNPFRDTTVAMYEQEALRKTRFKDKREEFIRNKRYEYRRMKEVGENPELMQEWTKLYQKDIFTKCKTKEELFKFYESPNKKTLADIIANNTNQDKRHFLLDMLI